MRIKVLKWPNVATDFWNGDGFRVGDSYDVSAGLAIPMTAAGWVRRVFERRHTRRSYVNRVLLFADRRLLADRRTTEAV